MSTPLKSQAILPSDISVHSKQGQRRTIRPVERFRSTKVTAFAESMTMPIVPKRSNAYPNQPAPMVALSYPSKATEHKSHVCSVEALPEQIDLSQLGNFEIVQNQYEKQGIQFQNAIALHPSNPAFPPYNSNAIILGGPKSGILDIVFSHPVHTVEASVTSSGVTIMTVFNDKGDVMGTDETLGRNLADEHSPYPPHARLAVAAPGNQNIHHIRLRCGGGQLSLSNLSFRRMDC